MLKREDFSQEDWETVKAMKKAWQTTRQRCTNPACRDYKYYGGRGIRICERWASFENFLADMGLRPKGLTIDRIDVNGDYEPSNCRWATRKQQSSNTRSVDLIGWNGELLTISEWERRLGWKAGVLKARLRKLGYSLDEAFNKPVKPGEKLPGRVYKVRSKPDPSKLRRGTDHPFTRLSIPSIAYCRHMHSLGAPIGDLAKEYEVDYNTMKAACLGLKAYKEITC